MGSFPHPERGSPRPRSHGAGARAAPTKGAARAAREDGARGATAPPALATSQAQRHLSNFQPLPTPPPQDPAFGATRGARTALGPRTVGQNKCHPSLSPLRPGRPHGPRRRRLAGRRVFRTPGGLVPARPRLPGGASESGGEAAGKGQSRRQARAENRGGRAGSRPRALPSEARPRYPRRGRPQKRREGGNQDETQTRSPPPPPSPP